VIRDRGGAPLHFLLAHLALAVDGSPQSLRVLSIVFALATLPLCYDLARRLVGQSAGLIAAALAATSQLLTIYGTFARMYSLFAFTSALAVDLFVRALQRPDRRRAVIAAAAALLPLAVHPFGAFLFAGESAVALWLWRGCNLRAALPVLAIGPLAVPLLLPSLSSGRYTPGRDLTGKSAPDAAVRALGGAAGGHGVLFLLFAALALMGLWTLLRSRPPVAAFTALTLVVPPAILAAAGALGMTGDRLGPRHLIFTLPLWTTLVATGLTRLPAHIPVAVAAIVVAALAPAAVADPRNTPAGERDAVAAPATWLRGQIEPGDIVYPYAAAFLAALPRAAQARGYPREPVALMRAARLTRAAPAVLVALPLRTPLPQETARRLRADGVDAHAFDSWLILKRRGPFGTGATTLKAVTELLGRSAPILEGTSAYRSLLQLRGAACSALRASC